MLQTLIGSFAVSIALLGTGSALANDRKLGDELYQPNVGQGGKDVIWVPTPDDLVKEMLTQAGVTPTDLVFDLGSGDGKIAITAARDFGATSVGIEYNPDMAALATRNAQRAGVADKVKIINGDIFKEDFSKATVVTLYLLPSLNMKLRPTLLDMKPGTRIVSNSFDMGDWEADVRLGNNFTRGYFWIVPAKVQGQWEINGASELHKAELNLTQQFQSVGGTIKIDGKTTPLLSAKLSGDNLTFRYTNQFGKHRVAEVKVAGEKMVGNLLENTSLGEITASRLK